MNMLATVWRNQGRWLDKSFSGYWFWRFRLWVVDRHVGSVLERYGEQSIEARRALARCSRVHFAVQFGGMAPSWERTAVRKAKNAGLSTDDIRVVVRNRNFVEAGEWLAVRQTWWLSVAVAWVFPVVAGFRWVLLCVYTLTMPGEALDEGHHHCNFHHRLLGNLERCKSLHHSALGCRCEVSPSAQNASDSN